MEREKFRKKILEALNARLKAEPRALALWEGGSAANGTSDAYSDIDLTLVGRGSIEDLFREVEICLDETSKVSHRFVEPKSFWPGCFQRVYLLEGAPKHFFVDVAIFLETSQDLLREFTQIERHGCLVVHFDKEGLIKPRSVESRTFSEKHRRRLEEIEAAFPVYRIEVLKELDRGHTIDAFAFFMGGIVRPLVELMGMLYRPQRFDFGLRYLGKDFPEAERKTIERFLYVGNSEELRLRMSEAENLFHETRKRVRENLSMDQ